MPGIKSSNKIPFVRLAKGSDEYFQLLACFELRIVRKITGDDLLLMKVTHLNRYIDKDLSNPWPAVQNDCLDDVPLLSNAILPCRYTSTDSV